MTMTDKPSQAITGQAAEMLRALHNAALFAGTDDTLPVLTQVHFRVVEGTQVVEGTDRHAAAQQMLRSVYPPDGTLDGVLLSAKDLTRAAKAFRKVMRREISPHVRAAAQITITVADGAAEAALVLTRPSRTDVTGQAAVHIPPPGNSWPAAAVDALWKAHHRRLAKLDGKPWNRRHVFRAAQLARLAQVEGDGSSSYGDNVQMQFTTTGKTCYVEIGTEFRALVQPVSESAPLRKAATGAYSAVGQ
jgi:hypothetical protein